MTLNPAHSASRPHCARYRFVAAAVVLAIVMEPIAPGSVVISPAFAQSQSLSTQSPSTTSLAQPQLPPSLITHPRPSQALPDLGDESQALASPAQERKLGESVVRQIRAQGAYLDDPEINDYLNELGHRLVAARPDSPWDFQFFALPDPSVNAFALPGGFVGVN